MILNLTQHSATAEQLAAGVIDLPVERRAELSELLTFEALPTRAEIERRAAEIALLAYNSTSDIDVQAMIGGAPYLMSALESALKIQQIKPVYAFSRRESVEQSQPDGSVRKVNVFKHAGFIFA